MQSLSSGWNFDVVCLFVYKHLSNRWDNTFTRGGKYFSSRWNFNDLCLWTNTYLAEEKQFALAHRRLSSRRNWTLFVNKLLSSRRRRWPEAAIRSSVKAIIWINSINITFFQWKKVNRAYLSDLSWSKAILVQTSLSFSLSNLTLRPEAMRRCGAVGPRENLKNLKITAVTSARVHLHYVRSPEVLLNLYHSLFL